MRNLIKVSLVLYALSFGALFAQSHGSGNLHIVENLLSDGLSQDISSETFVDILGLSEMGSVSSLYNQKSLSLSAGDPMYRFSTNNGTVTFKASASNSFASSDVRFGKNINFVSDHTMVDITSFAMSHGSSNLRFFTQYTKGGDALIIFQDRQGNQAVYMSDRARSSYGIYNGRAYDLIKDTTQYNTGF